MLPALAAACIVAVAVVALVVVHGSGGNGGPAKPVPRTAGWQRVELPSDGRTVYGMRAAGFADPLHAWVTGLLNPPGGGLVRFAIWTTGDGGRSWTLHVPLQSLPATFTAATFGDSAHGWGARTGPHRIPRPTPSIAPRC